MLSLLSLGDSYTIGEGVPLYDSFPYQSVQLLRKSGHTVTAPEIIARTGWTTDELAAAIARTRLLPRYDLVSLCIGVNNQYRGRNAHDYGPQFLRLLQEAIRLAGNPHRVSVLSIPDWGVSPFAAGSGRNLPDIARDIDDFNQAALEIAGRYEVPFIDITIPGRKAGSGAHNFAADGLHPSAEQYRSWAEQLAGAFRPAIQ
jgi:lysophospholipase L1-like esterase